MLIKVHQHLKKKLTTEFLLSLSMILILKLVVELQLLSDLNLKKKDRQVKDKPLLVLKLKE